MRYLLTVARSSLPVYQPQTGLVKAWGGYQLDRMWSAILMAMDAPARLPAAKNSWNIGEPFELAKTLRLEATLAKEESSRSLYKSAMGPLPGGLVCLGSSPKSEPWRDWLYRPCHCSCPPKITARRDARAGVGSLFLAIIRATAINGKRIQQSTFSERAIASTVLQVTSVANGSRNTTARSRSFISLQKRGRTALASSLKTLMSFLGNSISNDRKDRTRSASFSMNTNRSKALS